MIQIVSNNHTILQYARPRNYNCQNRLHAFERCRLQYMYLADARRYYSSLHGNENTQSPIKEIKKYLKPISLTP